MELKRFINVAIMAMIFTFGAVFANGAAPTITSATNSSDFNDATRTAFPAPPYVVVGSGPTASDIKIFDMRGNLRSQFRPFPGFFGEISVGAGDVNGDGVPDVIACVESGSTAVRVFSGRDGRVLHEFSAFGGFSGGVYVATGDINGDGKDDIIVAAGGSNGHVKVFDGDSGALLASFFAYPGSASGARVASGDVNGDRTDDIITGATFNGHVKVFSGADGALLASFFAFPGFSGGVYVAAGDNNGDGRDDIIVGADAGAGGHVKVFDGVTGAEIRSFFAYSASFAGGVRVAAGHTDNDRFAEIITVAPDIGATPHIKIFSGSSGAEVLNIFPYSTDYQNGAYIAVANGSRVRPTPRRGQSRVGN